MPLPPGSERTSLCEMPKSAKVSSKGKRRNAGGANFKTYISRARIPGACGGAREGMACCVRCRTAEGMCVRRAGAVGRWSQMSRAGTRWCAP